MRIRMLDSFTGPGVEWLYGKIYDIPEDEAMRMISKGAAELPSDEQIELIDTIEKAKARLKELQDKETKKDAAPVRVKCKGKTKAGKPCQRKPLIKGDYCSAHKK